MKSSMAWRALRHQPRATRSRATWPPLLRLYAAPAPRDLEEFHEPPKRARRKHRAPVRDGPETQDAVTSMRVTLLKFLGNWIVLDYVIM